MLRAARLASISLAVSCGPAPPAATTADISGAEATTTDESGEGSSSGESSTSGDQTTSSTGRGPTTGEEVCVPDPAAYQQACASDCWKNDECIGNTNLDGCLESCKAGPGKDTEACLCGATALESCRAALTCDQRGSPYAPESPCAASRTDFLVECIGCVTSFEFTSPTECAALRTCPEWEDNWFRCFDGMCMCVRSDFAWGCEVTADCAGMDEPALKAAAHECCGDVFP